MTLPIDVINKILIYIGELNNTPFILQYNQGYKYKIKKFYFKINPFSDYFLSIRALLVVRRLYKLKSYEQILNNKMLYKLSKKHYMDKLKYAN